MDEIGLVTFQRICDADTDGLATRIVSADPRIRVSPNFLDGSGRYPPASIRRHSRFRPSGLSGAFGCCPRTWPLSVLALLAVRR